MCHVPDRQEANLLGRNQGHEVLDNKWATQSCCQLVYPVYGRFRGREECVLEMELVYRVVQEQRKIEKDFGLLQLHQ